MSPSWRSDAGRRCACGERSAAGEREGRRLLAREIDRALDVNLRAPIQLTRALMPGMVDRRRGHLVFISSLSGKVATARSALYSATKFGLRGFATGLRETCTARAWE